MEQTFMTIHNLTPDANILYISESVVDILGYYPSEVLGRSCFDFFHPDEVPFARSVHSRGVLLDKAAVLHYARVLSRDGRWISCECCFTIVHDVLVACTSIYRRGEKSERRAIEAPQIRRIFSCSPRDPRYHMLEHLSPKFKMPAMEREPRAALILNRFTRTLSVMFATEAISSILGVPAEMVQHKSFYECIQESSLDDAFKCLESAKANDSIAYLRFWSRDPRRPEDFDQDDSEEEDEDEDGGSLEADMSRGNTAEASGVRAGSVRSQRSSDSENGGVKLEQEMEDERRQKSSPQIKLEPDIEMQDGGLFPPDTTFPLRTTSSGAAFPTASGGSRTYQSPLTAPSSVSPAHSRQGRSRRGLVPSVELEAVVSCTSDGLVVVLRKARPQIPDLHPPMVPFDLHDGLFAAPWAQRPIQPQYSPEALYTFRPPLMPQYMPLRENVKAAGGPPLDQLMRSIRDVAVFAWALVGINGNLASYGRGRPMGEAQPPEGLPIWDPSATHSQCTAPENQAVRRWAQREDEDEDPSYTPGARHLPGSHGPDARNQTMLGQPNYSLRSSDRWQTEMNQQHHYPRQPANDHIGSGDQLRPRNHGQTQFGTGLPTQMQRWDRADNHPFSPSREESRDYRYRWRS